MLDVVSKGQGPVALLIHGSAADHTTWTVQYAGLKEEINMLGYDRRAGLDEAGKRLTVEEHAEDAAEILRAECSGPVVVVGSSFGAVIALELTRRHPELVRALVLCEPPLAQSDMMAAVPDGFACHFDQLVESEGGPAAAEFFLRSVLGDEAFDNMPLTYRKRSMAAWSQIRDDMFALGCYRPRYGELAEAIRCPVYLCGGDRSAPFYADTLDMLELSIPGAERIHLRGAGHMMQVDAHRQFNELLRRVCTLD